MSIKKIKKILSESERLEEALIREQATYNNKELDTSIRGSLQSIRDGAEFKRLPWMEEIMSNYKDDEEEDV